MPTLVLVLLVISFLLQQCGASVPSHAANTALLRDQPASLTSSLPTKAPSLALTRNGGRAPAGRCIEMVLWDDGTAIVYRRTEGKKGARFLLKVKPETAARLLTRASAVCLEKFDGIEITTPDSPWYTVRVQTNGRSVRMGCKVPSELPPDSAPDPMHTAMDEIVKIGDEVLDSDQGTLLQSPRVVDAIYGFMRTGKWNYRPPSLHS